MMARAAEKQPPIERPSATAHRPRFGAGTGVLFAETITQEAIAGAEKKAIRRALEETKWKQKEAAALLENQLPLPVVQDQGIWNMIRLR
jgi:transcriptional regulator with GAF, ATPase, and Fis domain